MRLLVPSIPLCTDNGAMVAASGANRLALGEHDALDLEADSGLALATSGA
jgi:N6-L-threonylcarbamoyladenine synthase